MSRKVFPEIDKLIKFAEKIGNSREIPHKYLSGAYWVPASFLDRIEHLGSVCRGFELV